MQARRLAMLSFPVRLVRRGILYSLQSIDRTTPTGKMINGYLTGNAQQDDHSIHLLFSANRWEAIQEILKDIGSGVTVIIDRYSFSGAVYSAAKDNPDLSLQWGT
jgi:dTMP kinase